VDPVRTDPAHHFYWDGARAGRLEILRCQACGTWIHYPQPRCPRCLGTEVAPASVSGRGTVVSFTVTHAAPTPALAESLPITLVMVELEDAPGVRIVTNLVEHPDRVRIGLPVEVRFEEHGDEVLPQFCPA